MLTWLLALVITHSYVHMLRWSYMLPCLDALTITCLHVCMPPHKYVWMLWWSHADMPLCSHAHIFLHACPLTCLHASMIVCSHVHMIDFSHAWILTCLNAHMLMPWWSHAPMLTCLDDHLLPCSHALTMLPWIYALMVVCSHGHTHWYSNIWYPHTCTLDDVYILGGLSNHAVGRLYTQMLWRLSLNAEVIRW